jgi:hypothetical protein
MLNKKTETELKTECIKLLEKGKVGWDVPHTLLAVKKMRQLIKKEGGNETILIPTIYLHDTGYPYIEKNNNFQKMMESKKDHAEIAEKNAKIILKELNFSSAQIKTIGCLIKNHDKIDIITKTRNGQLVFEADSLAQIDLPSITPTFTKKETIKFLNYFKKHRLPKIKTKTGLTMIKTILKKAEKYIKNWN